MRYSCYIFFYCLIIPFSIRGNSNSNAIRNQVDEELLCECATSKSLFIYLSHTLNILNIAHVCREENNRKTHVVVFFALPTRLWLKIENSFGITTERTRQRGLCSPNLSLAHLLTHVLACLKLKGWILSLEDSFTVLYSQTYTHHLECFDIELSHVHPGLVDSVHGGNQERASAHG